ncbi:MAG: phospholipid carrier-dependent glycosyltransferase [Chloroflexi bacterium]|nr:phospholipid carrier-dependent glycosyltransferase [Chloroflexota bacterium]
MLIFFLFLAASIPGVNWGVPALWNPDELVWRVEKALNGELVFDQTEPDFNYPSLPKYVMYAIGKIVYGMGYSKSNFFIAARVFSALLGAVGGVLIYYLTRMIGADLYTSALAGLIYVASGVAATNGRFAHNDLYLQFFTILCIFFAIKYQFTRSRIWIYSSFLSVGLAASSKFTGGSLLLVPLTTFVILNWSEVRRDWFRSIEILLIGGGLCFGGYALGTPKALLWMAYYFKRVIPALQRYPQYGFNSGNAIGLVGQWPVFEGAVGVFVYLLFIICFIWFVSKLILWRAGKVRMEENRAGAITILVLTVLIFDLPFLISVNYIERYFIPFVPFLSILGALFVREILDLAQEKGLKFVPMTVGLLLVAGFAYSGLRLVSTALLFMNDARMPAGEFIAKLPGENKIIEYTLYPPLINRQQFYKAHNYPIFFLKYPDDVVPTGGKIEYNQGEQGLIEREVDYLVIDSLTYSRLYNDSICQSNPVECDFFRKLLAGEITSYRLLKDFVYKLPPYLPNFSVYAVNPEVRIYERVH